MDMLTFLVREQWNINQSCTKLNSLKTGFGFTFLLFISLKKKKKIFKETFMKSLDPLFRILKNFI